MTIDPNPLSITMHLKELDHHAEAMHRSRQGTEGEPRRIQSAPRVVDAWTVKATAFLLALRPTHRGHGENDSSTAAFPLKALSRRGLLRAR